MASAFTLVEMLVVMGVIVLIIGIASPVITSLGGAGDVNKAVYDISGILEQSRAYAMSNNTYVYVGFHEADVNSVESGPQTDLLSPSDKVGGRVSVAVIASKDGTLGYDVNNPGSWGTNYQQTNGSNFLVVGKVQRFNNLHIVDLGTPPNPSSYSGMVRGPFSNGVPTAIDPAYNFGNTGCQPVTYFKYPLGPAPNSSSIATYTFTKVIQYDPQGVARIQEQTNGNTIVKLIEIGLEQTHGNAAPALATPAIKGNIAALQIECMTGSTHIYRP